MLLCNFSQNITKVILIRRLKVAKNSTVRKNAQAGLRSYIKLSLIELCKSFLNGASEFCGIFTFEDIVQPRIHAKLFKCK